MKIERLVAAGFGALKPGLTLEFRPGLNLITAPNETGKSTLAELLTALFYGFGPRKGGAHPFDPWEGGETGGELFYRLADGTGYLLRRHITKRKETAELSDENGRPVNFAGREPGELHLGCPRGVFLTVARLGLDELGQAFSGNPGKERTVTEQALKGYFFQEAATRGSVTNPVAVRQQWREEREKLYSRDRRKGRGDSGLLAEIEKAQRRVDAANRREEEAKEARTGLDGLKEKSASLAREREAAEEELRRAQAALGQARNAARLAELRQQIQELSKQGLVSGEQAQSVQALFKDARELVNGAREARSQAEALAAQAAAQGLGREPREMEMDLDRLAGGLAAARARQREIQAREIVLAGRVKDLTARWGAPPAGLAALDDALPFRLSGLRDDLTQAQAKCRDMEARQDQAASSASLPPAGLALAGLGLALAVVSAILGWDWWGTALGGLAAAAAVGWLVGARRSHAALVAQAGQRLQAAQDEVTRLERELASAEAGLPRGLAEAQPSEMAAARESALNLAQDQAEAAQAQADWRGQWEELMRGLAALGLGEPDNPDQTIEEARRRCRGAAEAAQAAEEKRRTADDLAARTAAAQQKADQALAGLGANDLEGLAQAAARQQQVARLEAQAAEVAGRLPEGQDQPAPDIAQAEATVQEAAARLSELERTAREQAGRGGELRQVLRDLAASGGAAAAQGELARLEQDREELAREHDALLLGEALLERAMEHFRLEAQPNLLVKAAAYLEQATGGAYSWLGADLFQSDASKPPELSARPGPGARDREAAALSRGTRDQLYLALRLALADEVTAGGEILPLILDDPLVNFDDNRLASSLAMIGAVAGQRQVIMLTCHRKQAEILTGLAKCHMLSLE